MPADPKQPKPKTKTKPKKHRFKRFCIWSLSIISVLLLVAWLMLPRIAEKVIHGMIADAGLSDAQFTIDNIAWRSAKITTINVSDDAWSVRADEVYLTYRITDLLDGKIKSAHVEGLKITLRDVSSADETGTADTQPDNLTETAPASSIKELPLQLQNLGKLSAPSAVITWQRNSGTMEQTLDLNVLSIDETDASAKIFSEIFQLELLLSETNLDVDLLVTKPEPFLGLIAQVTESEGSFLPEGFAVEGALLSGQINTETLATTPITLKGSLTNITYDGGDKPAKLATSSASITLTQSLSTKGHVTLAGGLDSASFPLDPSSDFTLKQTTHSTPKWNARVTWGSETSGLIAQVSGLSLAGNFNGRNLTLNDTAFTTELFDNKLSIRGSLTHDQTAIPFRYDHDIKDEDNDRWTLDGFAMLGPVKHQQPLPALLAVTDLFEDLDFKGTSHTKFKFKSGSHTPFQGTLTTEISGGMLDGFDKMIQAEKFHGVWKLHLIPLEQGGTEDRSYYTLDFYVPKLIIGSKDALDFDLIHEAETPAHFTARGQLGDETSLDGKVENLHLFGEHEGKELLLSNTSISYKLLGDILTAQGETTLDENTLPFHYRHERQTNDKEEWTLRGNVNIPATVLKQPISCAAIFVDAMEDKTLTGKATMKMNFSLGSKQDFDAKLTASVSDGTLLLLTDGEVDTTINGLAGGIRIPSLKTIHTAEFSRVTAKSISAFDLEMKDLRLDYKMLKNGDIQLRNVALKTLGGVVWLDPFTMPADDGDYTFKVRMKRLDIAQLATLFPDFNGKITGRLDGLLPMAYRKGEFMPTRGGMYLTPRTRGKLRYDAGDKFSGGVDPKSQQFKQMRMVEKSLKNLNLQVLSIRLFDPRDKDKAIVLKLKGHAPSVPGSPPIHLNINGFKPDDDTVNFFDLLLRHRDKLNFGL